MDQGHHTTEAYHKKGAHLNFAERRVIEVLYKQGKSLRKIAEEIGCAPNTVRNELKRGQRLIYNGRYQTYDALRGQEHCDHFKKQKGRKFDYLQKYSFFGYVIKHFCEDKWSLDACVGRALSTGVFSKAERVCTKTLYNYVERGLLEDIRDIDLPLKVKRKRTKKRKRRIRQYKRKLGRSIEERAASVEERKEFGHWEADLVVGPPCGGDMVLLSMLERKTREYIIVRAASKKSRDIMKAVKKVMYSCGKEIGAIFKSITTDNGLEFSELSSLEELTKTLVYYAHPYSSYEKGSIERHNGILRRFIHKGERIDSISEEELIKIENWCNSLPRKLLNYASPRELFMKELDAVYAASS